MYSLYTPAPARRAPYPSSSRYDLCRYVYSIFSLTSLEANPVASGFFGLIHLAVCPFNQFLRAVVVIDEHHHADA